MVLNNGRIFGKSKTVSAKKLFSFASWGVWGHAPPPGKKDGTGALGVSS